MWKPEHRLAADRRGLRYPSDLTDAEWAIVAAMMVNRLPNLTLPDSAVVASRAPGAGARGCRRRLGAIDIQQRMPNLSYDQGRRQSPGPKLTQRHREESRLAAELRLLQCYEGRGLRLGGIDSFIAKPDEVVPGNSMKRYGGLASAEDRTKLIAFLQSPTPD